jgi:ketosteroid isomerase-like protein
MTHPRMAEAQSAWDALAAGDPGPAFDSLAEDVVVENGPGAGPWRHVVGRDALAVMLMTFAGQFRDDWKQEGRVVYADDQVVVTLVKETGTATAGDRFDNLAVYVTRIGNDGKTDRLWTVDLAHEAVEEFWRRNQPAVPA